MEYLREEINISRKHLLDRLKQRLSPGRYEHIRRVEEMALRLAAHYGEDCERVSIAALLHDYCKEDDVQEMKKLALSYYQDQEIEAAGPFIWHGLAAAYIAREEFEVADPSILQAIAWHPVGQLEMDLLSKIIYTADYIEEGRSFEGVQDIRLLAFENIDEACFFQMARTLSHLALNGRPIFVRSIYIYNHWIQKLKEENK